MFYTSIENITYSIFIKVFGILCLGIKVIGILFEISNEQVNMSTYITNTLRCSESKTYTTNYVANKNY